MSKWIWATFEGLIGLLIGAFVGSLLSGATMMTIATIWPDPPHGVRTVLLSLVVPGFGLGCAVHFAKRALDAYEGHGKPGRAVLTGKGGKPEFTPYSVAAFFLVAVAWAFFVLIIQAWGRH